MRRPRTSRRPSLGAARRLPPEMTTPPSYRKVNPADQPILYLVLTSDAVPMSALDEFAQTMIAQRISMVNGVAQVTVSGSQKYAVRIQLDPAALAAKDLGIDEVALAIDQQNVNMPLGSLSGSYRAVTVQANGQLTAADKYLPMLVAYRNGQPVRLRDLGRVIDSVENDKQVAPGTSRTARASDRSNSRSIRAAGHQHR